MKAFVSAQLTQEGLDQLAQYAQIKLGGWGHTGKKLTPEELVKAASDCEIMVICYEEINDYVLDHLPNLKLIACSRGGVENIDRQAVRRHSVWVTSAPGRNANAVAELTVGLMISALRHIPKTHHYIMSQQWDKVPWDIAGNTSFKTFDGYELCGKTIGLVGYGAIARRVAKLLSGFDVKLIAYDPFLTQWPEGVTSEALAGRQIACAALDAQVHEPMFHDSKFLTLDNIILTPHIGGASRDIIAQQTRIVMEDVTAYFETGKPIHVIQ